MAEDPGNAAGVPVVWLAGDLRIDTGMQRVEQGGAPLELPKLSFELLITLLQQAPDFVSNDELMSRVWPGLVVSPETVTQRVKLLRDALRDDPRTRQEFLAPATRSDL